jgi:regulatory subunit for Cdc7p protein kinase
MSATALQLSPIAVHTMSSRRVPLAPVPNAVNSPSRTLAAVGTKRSRAQAGDLRELPYGQAPPAKRQLRDADDLRRQTFLRKPTSVTAAQRKPETLLRAGRQSPQKAAQKPPKPAEQTLDTIRDWQKHYKKVFPKLVFFFDSVPQDVRSKLTRQVQSLGAVSSSTLPDLSPTY